MKPSFLIIGTQKGGTTSLFEYLRNHPQMSLPPKKELHFFSLFYNRGKHWYTKQFPKQSILQKKMSGEASPYYLFHPATPERVQRLFPEIKMIVLLRNPVDRAFSHYQMSLKKGNETITDFKEALKVEEIWLEEEIKKIKTLPDYISKKHQQQSYFSRGLYAEQLRRWFTFFPRTQFLILKSEELFTNPQTVMDQVCSFLNISAFKLEDSKIYNMGNDSDLDITARNEVSELYKDANLELQALLNWEQSW